MIFGRSLAGLPLAAERLGPARAPDGGGPLLVFGAIHGDEPESAELCHRLLARWRASPPPVPTLIAPAVNPDGLLVRRKNNGRDVDLNRNFAARSWTREHKPGYDPGAAPLSEPEAQALAGLVEQLAPRVIVAVHQPFACVNWDGPAGALAERMGAAAGHPAVASVGYPTPGSFGAFFGVDRQLAVITLELPRTIAEDAWDPWLRALDVAALECRREP